MLQPLARCDGDRDGGQRHAARERKGAPAAHRRNHYQGKRLAPRPKSLYRWRSPHDTRRSVSVHLQTSCRAAPTLSAAPPCSPARAPGSTTPTCSIVDGRIAGVGAGHCRRRPGARVIDAKGALGHAGAHRHPLPPRRISEPDDERPCRMAMRLRPPSRRTCGPSTPYIRRIRLLHRAAPAA